MLSLFRRILVVTLCASSPVLAWDYVYSDGSANEYRISPRELQYVPVTKENSSSGFYSGGTEKSVVLSDAQYRTISQLLDAALADKTAHTGTRVKMTGLIRRSTDSTNSASSSNGSRSAVILSPRAAVKQKIEAALASMLKPSD